MQAIVGGFYLHVFSAAPTMLVANFCQNLAITLKNESESRFLLFFIYIDNNKGFYLFLLLYLQKNNVFYLSIQSYFQD
ncbi:hypothetical protein DWG24_09190 [Dickeya zeae]|uniref:Uncharacterized protein n=1 Tax=Dickeya zeae TaxID=204042 RepID=A0AAE6YZX3_9GAMM|nr:hypothetical protein DWG24_09190 [Dickeya zeae]